MRNIGIVAGLALFVLVCVWILVESRWLRRSPTKPLRREDIENGFVPGARSMPSAALVFLGFAVVFFVSALAEYLHPPVPPFSGKGAALKTFAVSAMGQHGMAILFGVASVLFTGLGLANWIRRPGYGEVDTQGKARSS